MTAPQPCAPDVDVVIVGAGLSGIGAAVRLQGAHPGRSYTILEARDDLGGTWDLFRYPGVRSDSDMHTLGYSFRPWRDSRTLADGASILTYIRETAQEYGVDRRIEYGSRVVAADFDTRTSLWTLQVGDSGVGAGAGAGGAMRQVTCRFVYLCAGYYDYEDPHAPELAGLDDFAGTVVHPQFWPSDLDVTGKRVVVIGSGATAVTLVPALLKGRPGSGGSHGGAHDGSGGGAAAHVTMLQRTPTWIGSLRSVDLLAERLQAALPQPVAHRLVRAKNIAMSTALYEIAQRAPRLTGEALKRRAAEALGDRRIVDEHFTPPYDPWDQRLCAVPDGDLFHAIRDGSAQVVTGHVDTFVPEGIRLTSGEVLKADIIVTATGLRMQALGGVTLSVDGRPVELSAHFVWNGAMVTGLPNAAFCMGYTNASWTLRADLSHRFVCRVLAWMDEHGYAAVEPRPRRPLRPRPLLDLDAGYVRRSIDSFPRQGQRTPWRVRQNYVLDSLTTWRTSRSAALSATLAGIPAHPTSGPAASQPSAPEHSANGCR